MWFMLLHLIILMVIRLLLDLLVSTFIFNRNVEVGIMIS